MAKVTSKLLTFVLSIAMVVTSIGWLGVSEVNAAEGDSVFKVLVQDKDGNPVSGVDLALSDPEGLADDLEFGAPTGADGIAEFDTSSEGDEFLSVDNYGDDVYYTLEADGYEYEETQVVFGGTADDYYVISAGGQNYSGGPFVFTVAEPEEEPEGPVDFFDADVWPDWATTADELDGTEVLIDVRPYATYVKGHLPGSISCPVSNPYTEKQKEAIAKLYDANEDADSIVIVCVSGNMLAKNALTALQAAGKDMSNVSYLQGGANGVKSQWVTGDVSEKDPVIGEYKERRMTTVIDMSNAERYGKGDVVEVWVPVPMTDLLQSIRNEKLVAEKAEKAEFTVSEDHGNMMAYIKWGENVEPADRIARISFDAERKEVSRPDLEENLEAGYPASALEYLDEESEYVKVKAPIVQNTAAEITDGKIGPLEKARAIYDWCIANLERIDNGETLVNREGESKTFKVVGCGYGDTVQILTDLKEFGRAGGHCTDINSVFVALCRAAGVPAREMFGIRMGDDATGGQHCWAQFYLPGTGWVYADPGDVLKFGVKSNKSNLNMTVAEVEAARKSAETAKYTAMYWGGVDNNRIQLSTGRDVTLEPAQNDGVRNTFGYPYAEVNGKQEDDNGEYIDCTVGKEFKYSIKCTEIKKPVLVDARIPEVYAGWAVDGNEKGGHLEGAVNFAAQWIEAPYPANVTRYLSRSEGLQLALDNAGLKPEDDIIVYDTNDHDAQVVADFLEENGFDYVETRNKAHELATSDLVSYPNYKLNVPAEVVKNISDHVVSNAALDENAQAIVGDRNIRIFHAEYCAAGKYTDAGYMKDNDINWDATDKDGNYVSSYYGVGHVPGAEPISTDDFEPEREVNRSIIDNAKEGVQWAADYLLRDDEELIKLADKYGLHKDDFVVVVGYEPMATTKIALVMKYLGIDNVYVMSGAYTEWNQKNYGLEKEKINASAKGTDIKAIGNPDVIDTQDEAAAMLKDPAKYQLIDTRRVEEFEGKTSGYGYHDIAGKIEGTVNSPSGVGDSSSMYFYRNPDSTMLSAQAIEAMWKAQGVDTSKHMSFFCGSGWRAAEETWDAWVMGYNDASMYNDGWQGWSNAGRPFIDKDGNKVKVSGGKLVPATQVAKKAQPMTLKAKTVKLKAKTLKKKALKVKISKALTIKNAQGTKSYKITKVSKAKFKKYFKINAKSGKITVKKKLKKGTYKVTIQVTAKGNANYKAGSKKKVVTFKVK